MLRHALHGMMRHGMIAVIAGGGILLAQQSPSWSETTAAPSASEVTEPMEEAQPGDHWTYELRDEITGDVKATTTNVVTEVTAAAISLRISTVGKVGDGYITYDRAWNVTSNGIWKYAPNDGTGIQPPLVFGKTWTFRSTDVNSSQAASFKRSGTSKVTAQESVTTRAGTFDTFKIETSYLISNANDPTKKYNATLLTWYAPAINHWVKRVATSRSEGHVRDKSSIELVEYGRN